MTTIPVESAEDGALSVVLDEADLPPLLASFYEKVRADGILGPVFGAAIDDWPLHLGRLEAFWSSVMLGSGRYKGQPVAAHLAHADVIRPAMFDPWLAIWTSCTEQCLSPSAAKALQDKAKRIAESLALAMTHATAAQCAAYVTPVRTAPGRPFQSPCRADNASAVDPDLDASIQH